MEARRYLQGSAIVLLLLSQTPAMADEGSDAVAAQLAALRAKVDAQEAQLRALREQKEATWWNEQRAEQVREIVREVLADAETRASFQSDAVLAGYKNGFFIGSADGDFLLRTNIDGQVRYIYNSSDQPSGTDEDESGFVIRRARLDFRGHAFDPRLTYRIRFNADRSDGDLFLEYAYLGYNLTDNWNIAVGQLKPQFAREESVNAFRQLAVERSYVADYFTIDFSQGAELTFKNDWLRAFVAVHDGSYAGSSEFNADRTNIAFAGRAELLLAGNMKQFDDFTSWSNDPFGALIGAAVDYEIGEEGSGTHTPNIIKYTADVSLEFGGANFFAAFYGQHLDDNGSGGAGGLPSQLDGADQFGVVVQGGVFIVPDEVELFARYEWIHFDNVYYRNNGAGTQGGTGNLADDDLTILTAGVNYYIHKHSAKVSVDALYTLDPVPVANSGAGLLRSSDDNQFVLRAQLQWSF